MNQPKKGRGLPTLATVLAGQGIWHSAAEYFARPDCRGKGLGEGQQIAACVEGRLPRDHPILRWRTLSFEPATRREIDWILVDSV